MSRSLTTEFAQEHRRPYFLWDEDVSVAELREVLRAAPSPEGDRLLGKTLREPRDVDVWYFVTPAEVAGALDRLQHQIGRRYAFWRWLIDGWRSDGLLVQ